MIETKSKEDDFFGKFENSELKQEAQIEPAAKLVSAAPKETEKNQNLDKLTVDLDSKMTLKPV